MNLLFFLMLACMAGTLLVLIAGLANMVRGGNEEDAQKNSERSNKLMFWRVGLQALALVFLALWAMGKKGA